MKIQGLRIITALLFIIILIGSCRYKEGPEISFRQASYRLEGQYHIRKLFIDGTDFTQNYYDSCNCNILFTNQGGAILDNCNPLSKNGSINGWYYTFDNYKKIHLSFNAHHSSVDSLFGYGPLNYDRSTYWKILRLTNLEVIIEGKNLGKTYRFELEEFEY
jgi:hypothetical protein